MRSFPSGNDIEAVLFDVDGTLCDSDPLHYLTFRDMLQEVGFQGGVPITEDFFSKNISGKHNDDIGAMLFPDWDESQRKKFIDDKEALFRRMAAQHLEAVKGLHNLCKWIESCGLRRAAVTNAPRENAELMISMLGLTDFFELLIVGSECERAKPFPDPYLKALEHFKIPPNKAFALEDSPSGLKAAVAAGLPVLGVTTRNPGQVLLDAGATFLIKNFEDPSLWTALES
uniref:TSA: Wollemia nobilis Ref_Wollemi_Transcript_5383_1082 transcribed RNA sequence n=1 Tax=Wollemia nobilis TaxID=56998 RepID=A0A0C9RXR8_9CONI